MNNVVYDINTRLGKFYIYSSEDNSYFWIRKEGLFRDFINKTYSSPEYAVYALKKVLGDNFPSDWLQVAEIGKQEHKLSKSVKFQSKTQEVLMLIGGLAIGVVVFWVAITILETIGILESEIGLIVLTIILFAILFLLIRVFQPLRKK